jgi:hypothetical protein
MCNTLYRAGDLPNTGKREQVLIRVPWPVWGQGWSLCMLMLWKHHQSTPSKYITILRWGLETIGSSWLTKKFEQNRNHYLNYALYHSIWLQENLC